MIKNKNDIKTMNLPAGIMWLVATIASAIGMEIMAEFGLASIIYYLIPSVIFFVPTAIATLELSSRCNNDGGMYSWVSDVLGKGSGAFVVWLQWMSVIVFYPAILSFLVGIVAYMVDPTLLTKPNYMFMLTMIAGWFSIFMNMSGMRVSSILSFVGGLFAAVLPAILVFVMAIIWLYKGNQSAAKLGFNYLLPESISLSTLSLLPSFIVAFAGIEYSSYFINNMRNASRNYPISVIASVVIIIAVCMIGTFGISVLVDVNNLNIISAFMQAFDNFSRYYQISYLTKIIGILFSFGFVCVISTLMLSVAKGLLILSEEKILPLWMTKLNRYHVPYRIVFFQGIIMTLLCVMYLYLPSVNDVYWIAGMLASILVGIKYIYLFVSALNARKKLPLNCVIHPFIINKKLFSAFIWFGIMSCAAMIALAFVPPAKILNIKLSTYDTILLISLFITLIVPLICYFICKNGEIEA